MKRKLRKGNLIERFHNYISSRLRNNAYKVILATINHHRLLILINIHANLLAAALEGTTFGSIFLALKVLQPEESGDILNNPLIANTFLSGFLQQLTQGQLFIGLIVIAVLMQFLRHGLDYVGKVSADYLSARIQAEMVEHIFRQIMSFSFRCASAYKVGDLITYVNQSAAAIDKHITYSNLVIIGVMTILAQTVILFAISPALSGITIFLCCLILVIQKYLLPNIKRAAIDIAEVRVSVYKQIVESLQALRVIHTFARQSATIGQVHQLQAGLVPKLEYQSRLSRLSEPLGKILTLTTIAILLVVGFIILKDSNAVLPSLITFLAVLNRLSMHLNDVAGKVNLLAENSGEFSRLQEILEPEGKEFSRRSGKTFTGIHQDIRFDNISLQYSEAQAPALKNISFELEKGKVTALVGGSGAGKSSIADLLVGLYEPTQGAILVDGVNLRDYSMESWRSHLGVVSQDTFTFNQSILENIRYGQPTATEEEVIEAAIAAQADQFIRELPEGYQTIVGERGYRLSGGQRQRLALARAILKQPEILILDEATSALDSHSERLVQQTLALFQKQRTVLVIAHRLSTITDSDQIIVLENGQIVEKGSHQELLVANSKYTKYWQLQFQCD